MQISQFFVDEVRPFSAENYHSKLSTYLTSNLPEILRTNSILTAFTHKSFVHEVKSFTESFERLEFLGDAVLQILVSKKLYTIFPEADEGFLSQLRSSLVNESILSDFFKLFDLEKLVLLGKGELKESGHLKISIQANVFEAILGAIYLDKGIESASEFFDMTIEKYESENKKRLFSPKQLEHFDAKSKLQELIMKKYKSLPEYIISEKENKFKIDLKIEGNLVDSVLSNSKKKGMQLLAQKVLTNKWIENIKG